MSATSKQPSSSLLQITGVVLLIIAAGLMFVLSGDKDPSRPALGWMIGASFWLSGLIGMLFLLMIWWLFDAGWSVILRRQIEHVISGFLPIGLVLLPLMLFSVLNPANGLVPWSWMYLDNPVAGSAEAVRVDPLFTHKAGYLNTSFFSIRFIIYFTAWVGLAYLFRRWSFMMDQTGDHKYIYRSRVLAAVGIPITALAATFAAFDWYMSLEFHWFSTMYGVWFFASSMRIALAMLVLLMFWLATREDGLKGLLQRTHFYFMGCLMLAFTIFWAYISFSQYFLIYSANIPELTFWYNIREINKDGTKNSWFWISMVLVFANFLFPFLFLLWHKNKFGDRLKFIATWILLFQLADMYWNILPGKVPYGEGSNYFQREFTIGAVDVLALVGVGLLVIAAFLKSFQTYRPIPIRDPRIEESLHCHE